MLGYNFDFKLKTINKDFLVNEVSLLPDLESAPKKNTYFWLKKSNYTTFDALDKIKAFFNLNFEDVVAEGLKDEDGVTEQLVSVNKKLTKKAVKEFNEANSDSDTYIRIEIKGYGAEPLHAKALHGNAFRIVVRNLEKDQAEKILAYSRSHRYFPFINYYDNQRFGLPGGPYTTHLIGKAICEGNWDEAFVLLKDSGNEVPKGKKGKEAFLALNPSRVGFYVSAYNSFLWNNAVSDYIKKQGNAGKTDFPNLGELYLPLSMDIALPIGGFKSDGYYFNRDTFEVFERKNVRNIFSSSAVYADSLKEDELFKEKYRVTLSFFLNTGSYATMITKQFIKAAMEEQND